MRACDGCGLCPADGAVEVVIELARTVLDRGDGRCCSLDVRFERLDVTEADLADEGTLLVLAWEADEAALKAPAASSAFKISSASSTCAATIGIGRQVDDALDLSSDDDKVLVACDATLWVCVSACDARPLIDICTSTSESTLRCSMEVTALIAIHMQETRNQQLREAALVCHVEGPCVAHLGPPQQTVAPRSCPEALPLSVHLKQQVRPRFYDSR